MTAISGRDGKVLVGASDVVECTGWTLNRSPVTNQYGSSSTGHFKKAVPGKRSASGTISGMYDPANRVERWLRDGEYASLNLFINATQFFDMPALVSGLDLTVDMNDGTIEAWTCNWVSNGEWTEPT